MTKLMGKVLLGVGAFAMAALAVPGHAQEVKEKPPMYSYVANWAIPRAQWGEMEKSAMATDALMKKNLDGGTLVGYGADTVLVHEPDGETHDDWWSAMSMAGLVNVLEQSYKTGAATSTVLSTATKHWDNIYESRYYNWKAGSWKGAYTHVGIYKLKESAPDDAIDTLAKTLIVPLMEKLLADGTIHEYEIDSEAIHTQSPDSFSIVYMAVDGDALDKVNTAVRDAMKASPLSGTAFGSMIDLSAHRDYLLRTSATYK